LRPLKSAIRIELYQGVHAPVSICSSVMKKGKSCASDSPKVISMTFQIKML
jgi:hypothetical protein